MMTSVIPSHWTPTDVSNIAEVIMGQSPPGDTYNTDGIGLPFFQGKAEFGEFSPTAVKYCSAPTRIAEPNDILLSVRAPVGPTNFADQQCAIGRGLAAIRVRPDVVDPTFLLYFFRFIEPKLISLGSGSTFSAINRKDIETLNISLPPLIEQKRIVDFLHQADTLRQWRREANEKTNLILISIFNNLFGNFSNRIDFPVHPLESIADVVSGIAKGRRLSSPVNVPYLRVANVQAGYLDLKEIKTIEATLDEVATLVLKKGDVLLTEGGDFDKLGRGALLDVDLPNNCIHQNHIFRVRVDEKYLTPVFFSAYLQTAYARTYFLQASKRTTNLASINLSQLKALPVPIPPLELQEKFSERVEVFRSVEEIQSTNADKLDELYKSLMSHAFNGKLTASWREEHQKEMELAAVESNKVLGLRGEIATVGDVIEGRVTPEEDEHFRQALESIVKKLANDAAALSPYQEILKTIQQQSNFSEFAYLASQIADQSLVLKELENLVGKMTLPARQSLAGGVSSLQGTLSLAQAVEHSTEAYREVLAGNMAKIAADKIERERYRQELRYLELDEANLKIYELVQAVQGYFSAENLSQEHELPIEDIRNAIALFQALGLVLQVSIEDEEMSTRELAIFAPSYRAARTIDDSRDDDLSALESYLEGPNE